MHKSTVLFVVAIVLSASVLYSCVKPPSHKEYPGLVDAVPYENVQPPGIFLEKTHETPITMSSGLRKVYPKGVQLTKDFEGFINHAYNDPVGFCTIAYGHLIKRSACGKRSSLPSSFRGNISEELGSTLLVSDMGIAETAVQNALPYKQLRDGQFAALVDFIFNVGVGNFKKSTLLKRIKAGNENDVPYEFRRWKMADSQVLSGLVRRREAEIAMFFEGTRDIISKDQPPEQDLIDIRIGERQAAPSN